jgi:hypothetical protein
MEKSGDSKERKHNVALECGSVLLTDSGRISSTGASEYKLNNKVVTYTAYNAALVSHNILVKAKNFLVFQGDVEAVASQSPKELSRLIEQISGSLELEADYEKAKATQESATESATIQYNKRRGITGEIKQYKEQKSEADRFEALCQQRVCYIFSVNLLLEMTAYLIGYIDIEPHALQVVPHRAGNGSQFPRDQRTVKGFEWIAQGARGTRTAAGGCEGSTSHSQKCRNATREEN